MLGAKAHSTHHRWETSPNTPSGRDALERAKAVYKQKKKAEWSRPTLGPAGGPYVTEKAFEDVPGRLKRLEDDLEKEKRKVYALQGVCRQLAKAAGLHQILEQIE